MCKDISNNKGFVIPILNCIFRRLECISILHLWVHMKKGRRQSRILVDHYVSCWFIASIAFILIFYHWRSFTGNCWLYNGFICLILLLAIWRFVDIIQAWWNRYFVTPFVASAPRNIILTFVNYWEIIIVFAIVGLFFNLDPYYPPRGAGGAIGRL